MGRPREIFIRWPFRSGEDEFRVYFPATEIGLFIETSAFTSTLRLLNGTCRPPLARTAQELSQMTPLLLMISLLCCLSPSTPPDESGQVENPVYTRWKKFPVGTRVEYLQVTKAGTFQERRVIEYRLQQKSADQLTVEIRSRLQSQKTEDATTQSQTARRLFRLPPGVSPAQFGKPAGRKADGNQSLQIAGRTFRTNWFIADVRVEAGITETKSWSSDDVPGGLVRSLSQTPAANTTTTMDIVALEQPGQPAWMNPRPAQHPEDFNTTENSQEESPKK